MQIQAELGEGHANIIDAYEVGMVHLGSVASLHLNNCRDSDGCGGGSGRGGGGAGNNVVDFDCGSAGSSIGGCREVLNMDSSRSGGRNGSDGRIDGSASSSSCSGAAWEAAIVRPTAGRSSICPTRGAGRRRQPAAINAALIPTC